MYIERLSKQIFQITGIDQLPSRKLFKFNVYLSSLKNVDIVDSCEKIQICYKSQNEEEIIHLFLDLYSCLKTLIQNIEISENLKNEISKKEEENKKKAELISALKQIKEYNPEGSEDFEDFKTFCDDTLVIKLRQYQYKSAYLLSLGKGGFDFSVPGAGKTIITYATYAYLKKTHFINEIFVVGPLSSYNAWIDEYKTCFGQDADFMNLANSSTEDCKIYLSASAKNHKEVTFINVDKLRLLWHEICIYLDTSHALLVIDEAHKIKSLNAKATQAASEIAMHATSRILLTGTPMPNGYEDLYSLMKVFSPFNQILPFGFSQLKAITKKGASPIELHRIRESIKPYYSRISKRYLMETGELDSPVFNFVHVQMGHEQRELYDKLNLFCNKLNENIDEDLLMAMKKAALIRKMQISANPLLLKKGLMESMDELYTYYSSEKKEAELLESADKQIMDQFSESDIVKIINKFCLGELETTKNITAVELVSKIVQQGEKVLVWDIFVKNMEILQEKLDQIFPGKVELINGSVSLYDRQLAIHRFREGKSVILIANPATLAESISLHRACQTAVYVNRNYNCAQYIQSKDRIHRINMPLGKTATYYILINDDCIDEIVDERLFNKEKRMLQILDSDEIIVGGSEFEDISVMSIQDIDQSFRR